MNGGSDSMEVTVGGVKLVVPVFQDTITTNGIIQRVNDRLAKIEAGAARIDTQAFALQTAVSFAMELADLESKAEWDNRELLNALNAILKTLHKTIDAADENAAR